MESTQLDPGQVIARYLAGQLPAEQILRFKEGLARLQERGELAALLQAPAPRRWLPYAAAAAIVAATAIVALGALLWLNLSGPATSLLARSPGEFAAYQGQPPPIIGTYVLARTRGSASATDVIVPRTGGAIELRVLPSYPAAGYSARIRHLDPPADTIIGQIDAGAVAPDGYVTVYLDSRQLTPGDYEVSLARPAGPGASGTTDRFVIRVR